MSHASRSHRTVGLGTKLGLLITSLLIVLPSVHGQTTAPRRGMYVSLYATNIGALWFNNGDPKLVQFENILGNTAKEEEVLDFFKKFHINAFSSYDLHKILPFAGLSTSLRSFIARARAVGVEKVEAVVAINSDFDNVLAYQTGCASDAERFDGSVMEVEFWHTHNTSLVTVPLTYGRGLGLMGRGGATFYYGVYVGWVNATEIGAIAPLTDYMFPHCYMTDYTLCFDYNKVRITDLIATGQPTKVIAIPSAEGTAYTGGSPFLGDWLGAKNSVIDIEAPYRTKYNAFFPAESARFSGFQWYEYVFAKVYFGLVSYTATPSQTLPSSISRSDSFTATHGTDSKTKESHTDTNPSRTLTDSSGSITASHTKTTDLSHTKTAEPSHTKTIATTPVPPTTTPVPVTTTIGATTTVASTITGVPATTTATAAPATAVPATTSTPAPTAVPTTTGAPATPSTTTAVPTTASPPLTFGLNPAGSATGAPPTAANRGIFGSGGSSKATTLLIIALIVTAVLMHLVLILWYKLCRKPTAKEQDEDKPVEGNLDDSERA
jgi:hypothetical protein